MLARNSEFCYACGMKFIPPLTPEEQALLENLYHNQSLHRVRQRAHAILLNHAGFPIPQLAIIFGVQRDTVSDWLDRWMGEGEQGLYDLQRPGRPPLLDEQDVQQFKQILDQHPQQLKTAVATFEKQVGPRASVKTYKRSIKKD